MRAHRYISIVGQMGSVFSTRIYQLPSPMLVHAKEQAQTRTAIFLLDDTGKGSAFHRLTYCHPATGRQSGQRMRLALLWNGFPTACKKCQRANSSTMATTLLASKSHYLWAQIELKCNVTANNCNSDSITTALRMFSLTLSSFSIPLGSTQNF